MQPGLAFALRFSAATTISLLFTTRLFEPAVEVTMAVTMVLGRVLGLPMARTGEILTVDGFAMQIIGQCTALNYIVILLLAILLYNRHSIGYRMAGIVIGTGTVIVANALRLILTGLAGKISMDLFDFVHEYLWVAAFALLIFAIWKVWADRKVQLSKEGFLNIVVIASVSTSTFFFLTFFQDLHNALLAYAAAPFFKLLLCDPQATISMSDGMLLYQQGQTVIREGMYVEVANVSVYAGLMIPYLAANKKAVPVAVLMLATIVVMNADFIALMGMIGIRRGVETAKIFHYFGSGIFLGLPLAFYWIATGMAEEDRAATTGLTDRVLQ